MTQSLYDRFVKEYLYILLSPYGTVEHSKQIKPKAREIDLFFTPNQPLNQQLGLLAKMINGPVLIEPYYNPLTDNDIQDCILQELQVISEYNKQAQRSGTRQISEEQLPFLWVLTPTLSSDIITDFGCAVNLTEWVSGIYFLPMALRMAIIVIDELPKTVDTLWLRLLGKDSTQTEAIEELVKLEDTPLKQSIMEILIEFKKDQILKP